MTVTTLAPMTATESNTSRLERARTALDLAWRRGCLLDRKGYAASALRDADALLAGVETGLVEDAELLRGVLVGRRKVHNWLAYVA